MFTVLNNPRSRYRSLALSFSLCLSLYHSIYIYIYMYIHKYIHIYIYTYIIYISVALLGSNPISTLPFWLMEVLDRPMKESTLLGMINLRRRLALPLRTGGSLWPRGACTTACCFVSFACPLAPKTAPPSPRPPLPPLATPQRPPSSP